MIFNSKHLYYELVRRIRRLSPNHGHHGLDVLFHREAKQLQITEVVERENKVLAGFIVGFVCVCVCEWACPIKFLKITWPCVSTIFLKPNKMAKTWRYFKYNYINNINNNRATTEMNCFWYCSNMLDAMMLLPQRLLLHHHKVPQSDHHFHYDDDFNYIARTTIMMKMKIMPQD